MKIRLKHLVLTTALAAILAPAAMAQSANNPFLRGRFVAVDQRHQDEFDPEPVRAGAFVVNSSLGVTAEYSDNIFAEANNQDDDTIIHVNPDIEARSNWSSHELAAGLSVNHNAYIANDDETTTDYRGFVSGRIDVRRAFQLRGNATAAHLTEPRYEPGGGATTAPVEYDNIGASVGAVFRSDRLQVEGDVGTVDDNFDGAASAFRDVTETYVSGRASYAISPDVAIFVQGRTDDLDYDLPGTVLNPSRDGKRSWIQVGTNFELQAPFKGEIAIGQVKDEKDASALRDFDGLSVDGRLQWFPTQLTTLSFRAHRGIFDPGIQASPSATDTVYGVRIDHELMRNIVLFGDASVRKYEFENIDRNDDHTELKFGAGYKLSKHARIDAMYTLHSQESKGAARDPLRSDVNQNVLSVGLKVFP